MPDLTREEIEEIVHKLKKTSLSGIDLSGANLRDADPDYVYIKYPSSGHEQWDKYNECLKCGEFVYKLY